MVPPPATTATTKTTGKNNFTANVVMARNSGRLDMAYRDDDDDDDDAKNSSCPEPTKQAELDFARVLAGMPHGRVAATADTAAQTTTVVKVEAAPGRAPTSKSSPAKRSPEKKHRPYRRTKRPKDYCGLSTVTTATPAAEQKMNVFDTVLGEAEDLLRAATDAQCLGRLKMASNYLLLLHTRLIGLGIKFDRAKVVSPETLIAAAAAAASPSADGPTMQPANMFNKTNQRHLPTQSTDGPEHGSPERASLKQAPVAQTPPTKKVPYETAPSNGVNQAALHQLSNFIVDQGMLVDQTMVEHLARAAAELHQKRTGKKTTEDGLLNSPAMNTSSREVFHYNKDAKKDRNGGVASVSIRLSWTTEEQRKLRDAINEVGETNVAKIAKLVGTKSEAEVSNFLERDAAEQDQTPRKRGGRGRKPPTTAMNTVPNANFDAKAMLSGRSLGL